MRRSMLLFVLSGITPLLCAAAVPAIEPGWAETVARILAFPAVSVVLLSLGILGLLTELKAGAHGLGLLVGLLALGLFFGASIALGLAGVGTLMLLIVGLALLAVELLVIPGHGVTGVIGALLVSAAAVMAIAGPSPTAGDVLSAFGVLGASCVVTAAVAYGFIRHLPTSTRWQGLILRGSAESGQGYVSALPRGDLVGQTGVAVTDLRPAGTAEVAGERVDVVTEGGYVSAGGRILVVRSEGYRHVVRPAG